LDNNRAVLADKRAFYFGLQPENMPKKAAISVKPAMKIRIIAKIKLF